MKKIAITALILLMSLNVWADDSLQKITCLVEGAFFETGLFADAVEGLEKKLKDGELGTVEKNDTAWKIKHLTEFDAQMQEAGYLVEGQNWGWAEQLTQKELNAFLAGVGPDIIVGETQMPGFAMAGYLEPFPPELEAKVRELIVPGAYGPMEVDGKIYGIATYPGVNSLFWNKDLLRKAGLDPEKAPATWDEWLEMLQAVNEAGNGEFYGGGTYAGPNFGGSLRVGPFMMMAGGGFVDADGKPNFNTPGNVKALEFIRAADKNSPLGLAGAPGEGGWWDAFSQQKIAYVVDGPWRFPQASSIGIDCGYSPLPVPQGGQAANVTIGAAFYSVPTYAANKEGAFKFIETLFDRKIQDLVVEFNKRPPVLNAYGDDPEFMNSYIATFYKGLMGNVSGLPTYAGNQNAKIWDVFHQHMTQAIVTNGDVQSILKKAQKIAAGLK